MLLVALSLAFANPALETIKENEPEQYKLLWEQAPYPNRAGQLRFVGQALVDPYWTPLYINRYLHKEESTQVRQALQRRFQTGWAAMSGPTTCCAMSNRTGADQSLLIQIDKSGEASNPRAQTRGVSVTHGFARD